MGGSNYQSLAVPNIGAFGFNGTGHISTSGVEHIKESVTKPRAQDPIDIDEKVSILANVRVCSVNISTLQISRAVQQEVDRRLAEREAQERERLEALERQERERAAERERQDEEQRASLMRKHEELNKLLKKTLRKAEKEK